ncbi:MAG: galactokinase [Actinobacteria bacterium]|nr:galactokinase [Actinomycetota bacterium]
MTVAAFAPGRVNLIGDHTDHTGGLAMPMAIQLGTTVTGETTGGDTIELRSGTQEEPAIVSIHVTTGELDGLSPSWARYVAGVVHELRPSAGFCGTVSTTLPIGGGLSSSAALELAVALALGFGGGALELAELCQRAEQIASGVPCGIMDQLASATGKPGHALLMNFTTMAVESVAIPERAAIVVIDSGQQRALADSAYGERRAACEQASMIVGALLHASVDDLYRIDDPVTRRRAHHVMTENIRVRDFAAAIRTGDLAAAGACMTASHRSLRDDFEVSTDVLDALVDRLVATDGVHGARLTGAGFGGCVVALTEPGALTEGWTVVPSGPARRLQA